MKQECKACAVEKDLEDFHRDKAAPTGRRKVCKVCATAKAMTWNQNNPERAKLNSDKARFKKIAALEASPDLADADRARKRDRYNNDPEFRAYMRNAEKTYHSNRTAAKVDKILSAEVFERSNWICGVCREEVDPSILFPDRYSATVDHIVPLSRGGLHSYDNVQLAHYRCNSAKGNRLTEAEDKQAQ